MFGCREGLDSTKAVSSVMNPKEGAPGGAHTVQLTIGRIPEGDGIDLILPADGLEQYETLDGSHFQVIMQSDHSSVGFLESLVQGERVLLAVRDGLGQRLFRATVAAPGSPRRQTPRSAGQPTAERATDCCFAFLVTG